MKSRRSFLFLLLMVPTLTGCSLVRGAPSSAPTPRPVDPEVYVRSRGSDEAARITSGVVETALDAVGTPYVWGGTSENGFDCSGLIQYSYGKFGARLPRVSLEQLRAGGGIEPRISDLLPGDILGFSEKPGGKSGHVGLYLGRGDFIHGGSSGVAVAKLANPYWEQHFIAARRIVW